MSIYDTDCEEGCRLLKAERKKLEAVKTWLKDAPTPLFLVPGQSPFISETEMEVWLENCPLKILEAEA